MVFRMKFFRLLLAPCGTGALLIALEPISSGQPTPDTVVWKGARFFAREVLPSGSAFTWPPESGRRLAELEPASDSAIAMEINSHKQTDTDGAVPHTRSLHKRKELIEVSPPSPAPPPLPELPDSIWTKWNAVGAHQCAEDASTGSTSNLICGGYAAPVVAMCFCGSARTLEQPAVYRSIRTNVMDAFGGSKTTVFASIKLNE